MNETIKTIMGRRSTRGFKPEQLTDEQVSTIIDCGLGAPSGMNTQGWHFTVIQNQELIGWINEQVKAVLPELSRERMIGRSGVNFSIFYNAPTVVLVSGAAADGWTDTNCGLAAENMCLAAHSIGVASCIIGMIKPLFSLEKADEYIAELKVPDGYKPLYAIAFGYAAADMPKPERVEGKVSYIK